MEEVDFLGKYYLFNGLRTSSVTSLPSGKSRDSTGTKTPFRNRARILSDAGDAERARCDGWCAGSEFSFAARSCASPCRLGISDFAPSRRTPPVIPP